MIRIRSAQPGGHIPTWLSATVLLTLMGILIAWGTGAFGNFGVPKPEYTYFVNAMAPVEISFQEANGRQTDIRPKLPWTFYTKQPLLFIHASPPVGENFIIAGWVKEGDRVIMETDNVTRTRSGISLTFPR